MDEENVLWMIIILFTIYLVKVTIKETALKIGEKMMRNELVIVTGGNSGIGYEVALAIAKRNGRVILACRNDERGLKAQNDIRLASGNNNVFFWKLDLSSFTSIREFVKRVKKEEKYIYSLVNNAGLFWVPYQKTLDGFESNLGVNHLGPFLLTILLLPMMKKDHSRILFVGSLTYIFGKINFQEINCKEENYNFVTAYFESKLANLLTCRELSRRLLNQNIRTYCTDPGIVSTQIGKDSFFMGSALYRCFLQPFVSSLWMRTPEEGALSSIYCICADEVSNESGKFYTAQGEEEPWPSGADDKAAQKLWDISIQLTKLKKSELTPHVC